MENNKTWRDFCEKDVLKTDFLGQIYIDEIHLNREMLNATSDDKRFYQRIKVGVGEGMCDVNQLHTLLFQASEVALENETYDGCAIRKWVECYVDEPIFEDVNKKVYKAISDLRLKFHHAGGGDGSIRVLLQNLEPQFGAISNLKLLTVFDSDKNSKDETGSKNASLKTFLDENGYKYHCLVKREMENYFPLSLFQACGLIKKNKPVPTYTDESWDYVKIPKEKYLDYDKPNMRDLAANATKEHIKQRIAHQEKFPSTKGNVDEIQHVILLFAKFV